MLMWVEMNMVTTARMGKISRGRLSAARLYWGTRVRSMPKKSMWLPNSVMVLSWSAVNTEVTRDTKDRKSVVEKNISASEMNKRRLEYARKLDEERWAR